MLSRVSKSNSWSNCLLNPPSLFVGAAGAESGNGRDSGPDDTRIVAASSF